MIVLKVHLPAKGNWEVILDFDYVGKGLVVSDEFMRKSHFRNASQRVAKSTVDAEI